VARRCTLESRNNEAKVKSAIAERANVAGLFVRPDRNAPGRLRSLYVRPKKDSSEIKPSSTYTRGPGSSAMNWWPLLLSRAHAAGGLEHGSTPIPRWCGRCWPPVAHVPVASASAATSPEARTRRGRERLAAEHRTCKTTSVNKLAMAFLLGLDRKARGLDCTKVSADMMELNKYKCTTYSIGRAVACNKWACCSWGEHSRACGCACACVSVELTMLFVPSPFHSRRKCRARALDRAFGRQ
jgi:hypothetical protein